MLRYVKPLITVILLLLFILCPFSAQAEKLNWVDSTYDFTKIKKALVYDIDMVDTAEMESDLTEKILLEEYLKTATKPPYRLIRPDKAAVLSPDKPSAAADIYIKAELLKWHDDSYVKSPYTSWETVSSTRRVKKADGTWTEERYYETVPVYHPAEIVYTSTVRVKFDVYDSKTDKLVMSRDELRERSSSRHGQQGIFGRISKSFFDDLGEKLNQDE